MWRAHTFACRVETLQKPFGAESHGRWNNEFKAKSLRSFGERSDLLLAVSGFVVFIPFVDVLLAVLDEPEKQTSQLAGHGGNCFGSAQASAQAAVLGAQVTSATQ